MHRIDSHGTAVALPSPAAVGATVGYFTEGNPGTGTPATVVSADWANALQEELAYVIEQAGVTLDKTVRTQLKTAIENMIKGGQSTVQAVVFGDSPYTTLANKRQVKVDTSGGSVTINLPAASGVNGLRFTFVKTTADANTVTLDGNGAEQINGENTQVIDQQWTVLEILSIGTGWVIV